MEAIAAEFGACSNHTAEKVLDAIDRAPFPSRSCTVWEVERDRFGTMFSGPLEVGECREVVPREVLEEAEREKKRRGELNRTLFDKLKAALARAEEAERERDRMYQRALDAESHARFGPMDVDARVRALRALADVVTAERDEARAALTAAQEKIARAPHAKHCEAGAPMWPGPCTCWKREALSDTDHEEG